MNICFLERMQFEINVSFQIVWNVIFVEIKTRKLLYNWSVISLGTQDSTRMKITWRHRAITMKVPLENKDPAGIHNATIKIQQRWYYALLTHDLSQVTQYGLLQYHYLTKKVCSTFRAKRASNIFEVFPENLLKTKN